MSSPRLSVRDVDWSAPDAVTRYGLELNRLERRVDSVYSFIVLFLSFTIAVMLLLVAKLG